MNMIRSIPYTRCIGILGGSFNPAHEGHVHLSRMAMRQVGLDGVWWLVSPQNPLKSDGEMADFSRRFSTAQAVASHYPFIRVSDFEQRHQTCYTVDTLQLLVTAHPDIQFVWLMGADNLAQMPRWKHWKQLFSLVPVAVYDRAPYTYKALCGKVASIFRQARVHPHQLARHPLPAWSFLHGRRHPLSATALRKSLGDAAFLRHNEKAVNGKIPRKRR